MDISYLFHTSLAVIMNRNEIMAPVTQFKNGVIDLWFFNTSSVNYTLRSMRKYYSYLQEMLEDTF